MRRKMPPAKTVLWSGHPLPRVRPRSRVRPDGLGRPALHWHGLGFLIPASLPRRTRGDPECVRRACETDSPPASYFQSDIQKHRRHRLPRQPCVVFPEADPPWKSSPGILPRVHILRRQPPVPYARASSSPGRFAALPETTSRRAPLPNKSPESSGFLRTAQGSGQCSTASKGGDENGSNPPCRKESENDGELNPQSGTPGW